MKNLWLTYAWADNEHNDVDYIAQELRQRGINVKMDRWSIVAGRRLWDQIGESIASPALCDGWAIVATENSLKSEPCREELSIALDRALHGRGDNFPIIGIFPKSVAYDLIPPAIRIRLFVTLTDADWRDRVIGGLEGRAPNPSSDVPAFHKAFHKSGEKVVLELRPRAGRWYPSIVAVPIEEMSKVQAVTFGPAGKLPSMWTMMGCSEGPNKSNTLYVWTIEQAATPADSLYIHYREPPTKIIFGQEGGLFVI